MNGRRPASEVVVLMLAMGVSITMVLAAGGVVVLAIVYPERDLSAAIESITRLLTVVVGVVVGYLAGMRTPDRGR